jgi:hypothetical protein
MCAAGELTCVWRVADGAAGELTCVWRVADGAAGDVRVACGGWRIAQVLRCNLH